MVTAPYGTDILYIIHMGMCYGDGCTNLPLRFQTLFLSRRLYREAPCISCGTMLLPTCPPVAPREFPAFAKPLSPMKSSVYKYEPLPHMQFPDHPAMSTSLYTCQLPNVKKMEFPTNL